MPELTVLLAEPRGSCAGVERAIEIVRAALRKYGAPVYVRHAIVHNQTVVGGLIAEGAVFVEDLAEVPKDRPVVLSAHGVPKSVIEDAENRNLIYVDAACPLVVKVHGEVRHLHDQGFEIALIGHAGHQEVIGTLGQLPEGIIHLVEDEAGAETFVPRQTERLAYVMQTTLSVDEAGRIEAVLKRRFPNIRGPRTEDICYATTNRQKAVKKMVSLGAQIIFVVGSPASSNSKRLVEVAREAGCQAELTPKAHDIPWHMLRSPELKTIGVTAGASAPESDVREVVGYLGGYFATTVLSVKVAEERHKFNLPPGLR
ncbi:MAG TPA: 4-hydroxy-3-methylbut-2-enyl diphosphate reductase [Candidatus Paceibacterota bacterium]|nr:4-hydroxy-3-methylbut-2-enyl diphosphate reductase [Candidatus Paceibacterota bacterium]